MIWDEPLQDEGGPSINLITILTSELSKWGNISFRINGSVPNGLRLISDLPSPFAFHSRRWKIVEAQDFHSIAMLFDYGWSNGDQLSLINASDNRVRKLLSLKDLSKEILIGNEMIFASIVDGIGALIATSNIDRLERVLISMKTALQDSEFLVEDEY